MKRRSLLLGVSAVALLGTVAPALAQSAMTPTGKSILAQMVKDIFPHPEWDDAIYAPALGQLEGLVAGAFSEDLKSLGETYLEMGVADRIAALKAIEPTAFFQTVRIVGLFGLYGSPPAWQQVGYEGPSYEEGGYLFRGFDDIDWLPQPDGDILP